MVKPASNGTSSYGLPQDNADVMRVEEVYKGGDSVIV